MILHFRCEGPLVKDWPQIQVFMVDKGFTFFVAFLFMSSARHLAFKNSRPISDQCEGCSQCMDECTSEILVMAEQICKLGKRKWKKSTNEKPKQYFSGHNTSKQWTWQHQEEQTQREWTFHGVACMSYCMTLGLTIADLVCFRNVHRVCCCFHTCLLLVLQWPFILKTCTFVCIFAPNLVLHDRLVMGCSRDVSSTVVYM